MKIVKQENVAFKKVFKKWIIIEHNYKIMVDVKPNAITYMMYINPKKQAER